jgi:hypothetical protein
MVKCVVAYMHFAVKKLHCAAHVNHSDIEECFSIRVSVQHPETYLHPMLRLTMIGAIPPLLLYAFMASNRKMYLTLSGNVCAGGVCFSEM